MEDPRHRPGLRRWPRGHRPRLRRRRHRRHGIPDSPSHLLTILTLSRLPQPLRIRPRDPFLPLAQWRTEVIALTNAERTRAGLGTLTEEARLTTAAQSHSDDMAGRNYFDHTGLDGRHPADRVTAAGYTYRRCAENIAAGQQSPAEVVDGWMNSPGHRANILTPDLTQIGIGIAHGGTYGIYWTQVFGTPMGSANPFGG
ncbi:CAP domain-containing protein [Yinghuangia aomiensis]